MKINKKCIGCGESFMVNRNNRFILCKYCRGKNTNASNHKDLQKKFINLFNNRYKYLKINNTSGYLNLSINLNNLHLGNSIRGVLDKEPQKEYLLKCIDILNCELINLNSSEELNKK